MKISCPSCNASGEIPFHAIPEEGRFLNCPRCNHGFTVTRPKNDPNLFLVDTCPACNYSSFGEERFENCPKCGVVIKTFMERQREEQRLLKEQELLEKKHGPAQNIPEGSPPAENVVDEKMLPFQITGWVCGAAAAVLFIMGISGVLDYSPEMLKERITFERDEQVSSWYVFSRYGLLPWLKTLYGASTLVSVYFYFQRRVDALKALLFLLRGALVFVPLYLLIGFVSWILQPIPHSIGGYLVQILNMVLMCLLFGGPLLILERLLRDKRITVHVG